MKNRKISFESEHIIVDNENVPVNIINGKQTNLIILDLIKNKYGESLACNFKKELDACQIEFTNSGGKDSFFEAQDEMIRLFLALEDIVKNELGLIILKGSVPNQNFEPIYSEGVDRYSVIDEKLRGISLDVRKATNIAGIHFHIDLNRKGEKFNLDSYTKISTELNKIFHEDKNKIFLGEERFLQMKKVVSSLKKLRFFSGKKILSDLIPIDYSFGENIVNIQNILFNESLDPNFTYNLFSLKKPGGNLTMETRTVDGVGKSEDLIEKTSGIYNLINDILK